MNPSVVIVYELVRSSFLRFFVVSQETNELKQEESYCMSFIFVRSSITKMSKVVPSLVSPDSHPTMKFKIYPETKNKSVFDRTKERKP